VGRIKAAEGPEDSILGFSAWWNVPENRGPSQGDASKHVASGLMLWIALTRAVGRANLCNVR
jgi:hypothetical protein